MSRENALRLSDLRLLCGHFRRAAGSAAPPIVTGICGMERGYTPLSGKLVRAGSCNCINQGFHDNYGAAAVFRWASRRRDAKTIFQNTFQ